MVGKRWRSDEGRRCPVSSLADVSDSSLVASDLRPRPYDPHPPTHPPLRSLGGTRGGGPPRRRRGRWNRGPGASLRGGRGRRPARRSPPEGMHRFGPLTRGARSLGRRSRAGGVRERGPSGSGRAVPGTGRGVCGSSLGPRARPFESHRLAPRAVPYSEGRVRPRPVGVVCPPPLAGRVKWNPRRDGGVQQGWKGVSLRCSEPL